jgi:hypothetical protein
MSSNTFSKKLVFSNDFNSFQVDNRNKNNLSNYLTNNCVNENSFNIETNNNINVNKFLFFINVRKNKITQT